MKPTISNLHVVGCGGVASYLLPVLLKTFAIKCLTLHDGDKLEARNLDRQLFSEEQIGMNKAAALAALMQKAGHVDGSIRVEPEYFHCGTVVETGSLIIGTVDNHAARAAILMVADSENCDVVFGANEYTDSQAMYYKPAWRGTPLDPRVRFPEITTDDSDDPLRPASCQGEAQRQNSQLAMANFGAANHVMWLLWFWLVEAAKLDPEVRDSFSPIMHSNTATRMGTTLNGGLKNA